MKFKLFGRTVIFRSPLVIIRNPNSTTFGLTNRTLDNYFLPFLDYDDVEYKVVLEDVDFLQKNFDVGTALIRYREDKEEKMESGEIVGNYHVFFFTKFTFPEVKEIISLTRCDSHFKKGYRYQQRCWVLRIGEKLKDDGSIVPSYKLKKVIKSKTKRVANLGLIRFFELLDGIKLKHFFSKTDNINEVELIKYRS